MKKPASRPQKHILIVEDEEPIAETIDLKLGASGFRTTIVRDGKKALELLARQKVDLILLDLVMPVMDGFEVLKKLKSEKKETPIFVLTNLGQEEDAQRCKELGAHDYFVKADMPIAALVEKIHGFF